MIEEAAGTRMYEVKKQAAQRTIEKKDLKLSELNTVSKDIENGVSGAWLWTWLYFRRFYKKK